MERRRDRTPLVSASVLSGPDVDPSFVLDAERAVSVCPRIRILYSPCASVCALRCVRESPRGRV